MASAFSALNEGADESDAGGSDSPEMNKVVEMCLSHSAEYKMVVFDVEKIMKALSSHSNRMKVMYVIDGICRKARGKSKDQFQSRFAGRMKQISALLDGCEGSVRTNFVRLISAWRQQDIIPASSLPHIDPTIEKNVLDNNRSSKDNNEADQPQKENKQKKTGNGKIIKYCSFREGSCPFGEKCRFSHAAQGADYMIVRRTTKRLADQQHAGSLEKKLKYAKVDVKKVSTNRDLLRLESKIPNSCIPVQGTKDSSARVEFRRTKIDAYTTRSDVQVSSISQEDLGKIFVSVK